jgi:hypothetical protein
VALSTNVDGGEVMLATAQERPAIAFRERAGDPGLAFFRRMGPGEADQVDIRQLEVLNMGVDDEEAYLRLIHKGAIGLISQRGLQLSSGGGPQVELLLKGAGPLLKLLDGKGQVRFEVPAPKK